MQRDKIFGFPLTDEFLEGRPQFTPLMEKCPHADGEERLQYAFRVRSAILMAISLRTRRLWYNTCIEMSTSGPVIALATDWQSTALPPPEVIKSIQTSLRIGFEPRWVNAFHTKSIALTVVKNPWFSVRRLPSPLIFHQQLTRIRNSFDILAETGDYRAISVV
ncbi:hypothetical protein CPB85DRAFT_1315619 [Mucidula mucida]|nr:hypothetical protein CPB85DRAFT_1315619 [Mucidula mucida]